MAKSHLIIPDSHAHPDYDNRRYHLLAKLINDRKPDVVVDIGDWWDMPSLCSYDYGKKEFEGRRYKKDIEAGVEAQDIIYHEVRKHKRKLPRFVRCLGNHEDRINRAVSLQSNLEGLMSTNDLLSKEYGWEEYPFLESVNIDGVHYAHYFTSGVMNRPIGGVNPARSIILKEMVSSTQGHMHTFDHHSMTSGSGAKIHGCVVGVFQDYNSNYAGPANKLWDRGVVYKHNVENGDYDIEWISLDRLEKGYGRDI